MDTDDKNKKIELINMIGNNVNETVDAKQSRINGGFEKKNMQLNAILQKVSYNSMGFMERMRSKRKMKKLKKQLKKDIEALALRFSEPIRVGRMNKMERYASDVQETHFGHEMLAIILSHKMEIEKKGVDL